MWCQSTGAWPGADTTGVRVKRGRPTPRLDSTATVSFGARTHHGRVSFLWVCCNPCLCGEYSQGQKQEQATIEVALPSKPFALSMVSRTWIVFRSIRRVLYLSLQPKHEGQSHGHTTRADATNFNRLHGMSQPQTPHSLSLHTCSTSMYQGWAREALLLYVFL